VLTATPERVEMDATLAVRIEVASVVVRLALSYVSEERGWRVCPGDHERCQCLVVSDRRHGGGEAIDVLVSRDTPSDCQQALDAVWGGAARAVVLWDEPESLAYAIEALEQHATIIPERVIQLAHDAPRLSDRQRRTLRLVGAGRSNSEVSAALHQSSSTTKRDIAELLDIFDAPNRAGLMTTAGRLGFL
jgi:DNA-binding NarL/FixJ family response regulator